MPLSDIKFPNRPAFKSVNEDFSAYAGIRYYKAQLGLTYNFSNPIPVTLEVNCNSESDPASEWRDVFEYSNGVKLIYAYKLWITQDSMTQETYHLKVFVRYIRVDNTQVDLTEFTKTITITNGVAYRTPFLNSYFVLGGLIFFTTNNPTVIDESPTGGAGTWFLLLTENPVTLNMPSLSGGDLTQAQYGAFIECGMYTGYSDTSYDNSRNTLIAAGDGTDPTVPNTPTPEYDPTNPGGGDSPIYGPEVSDPIDFPGLPTVGVLSTNLVSAYNPTLQQLQALSSELWNTSFEQSISKILNDPFDGIIGLSMLPFNISAGAASNIKIGNYQTSVSAAKVTGQYAKVSGGSLTIPRAWNNFLDYTQTKVEVFIPFVGIVPVQIDDCMGKPLEIEYNIDLLSGSGVAFLKCGNSVLYALPVNVGYQVPLTGSNRAQLYTGIINIGMSAIVGGMHAGAAGAAIGASASAISTATTKQSDVQRSGALSANSGQLGDFTAYAIIHRPVQALPKDFKAFKGYTSNITGNLNTLSGYTEVEYIHLTGIDGATDTELQEIEALLKEGVII